MKICFVALLISLSAIDFALANDALKGKWTGSFSCDADKNLRMTLSIDEIENDNIKGVFEFRARGMLAKYAVRGTTTPAGEMLLEPGEWIIHPTRFRSSGLVGKIEEIGGKNVLRGRLTDCRTSSFFASRREPGVPPLPPLSKGMFDAKGPEWIDAVRGRIADFAARREADQHRWNQLQNDVRFSRVDKPTKDKLLSEVREARANVRADALLSELASGPKEFPQGIGRALYVLRQSERSDWPDNIKRRIHGAAEKQIFEALRPQLIQIRDLAADLPMSLEGLIKARASLAQVEDYRAALERSFGTMDKENLLAPMSQKIAELQASPVVAREFREALERTRRQPNPRVETANVIFRVMGPDESSSPLTPIAKEGTRLAALAEVEVANLAPSEDRNEPKANDLVEYMFDVIEGVNATFAAMRCAPGKYDFDPITIARCRMGELEIRLRSVSKIACQAERPGQQYVCEFDQRSQLVSFRTGKPIPIEESFSLGTQFPGGRLEGSRRARFVRAISGDGWVGSQVPSASR